MEDTMCIVIARAIKMSKMLFMFSRNDGPRGSGIHYLTWDSKATVIHEHKKGVWGRSWKMVCNSGGNQESFIEDNVLLKLGLEG